MMSFYLFTVMCPKGDDPSTYQQSHRSISVSVTAPTVALSGKLAIEFQDEPTYLDLSSPSSAQCTAAFEVNPKFKDISCVFTQVSTKSFTYVVTFLSWPTIPAENNVYFHNGNPPASSFLCDMTLVSVGVSCTVTDIISTNIRGNDVR